MKPEEKNPNHFRYIVIEELQKRLNLLEESSLPNKKELSEEIIKKFLEEFGDNKEINLISVEQVKEELKKLEKRQEVEKARYDDGR